MTPQQTGAIGPGQLFLPFTMYTFNTKDGKTYRTAFSPREIAQMYCYDAWDDCGNRYVVLTDETNFRTFEFNQ